MPLTFNIRHVEKRDLHLQGELALNDLELGAPDELVQAITPLSYDIRVERLSGSVLAQGRLRLKLRCECARCLKPFDQTLQIDNWTCDLPLHGEDKVPIDNDSVDLTPFIREDILLGFPQHPLCQTECHGLPKAPDNTSKQRSGASHSEESPAWAALNKLKL